MKAEVKAIETIKIVEKINRIEVFFNNPNWQLARIRKKTNNNKGVSLQWYHRNIKHCKRQVLTITCQQTGLPTKQWTNS